MSKNAPKGDKTNGNVNEKRTKDTKKGSRKHVSDSNSSSSVISFDAIDDKFEILPYDNDFDDAANYSLLQRKLQQYFDQKLSIIQTEFQGQIKALHEVIKNKDEVIGKLHTEVGELKQCCSFLTKETATLDSKVKENKISLTVTERNHNELVAKTSDLEDR